MSDYLPFPTRILGVDFDVADDVNLPNKALAWHTAGRVNILAPRSAGVGDGTTNDSGHLTTMDSYAGSEGLTGYIPRTLSGYALANNVTLANPLHLEGKLLPASGKVVTINGPFDAPPVQVFGGAGTVAFGPGACEKLYVEWWGGKGDGGTTDSTAAFVAALAASAASGINIHLLEGNYLVRGGVLGTLTGTIRGAGKWRTTITKISSGDMLTLGTQGTLRDLTITGQGATYTGRGLVINTGTGQQALHSIRVADMDSYCIDFTSTDAGSQFMSQDCEIWRTAGGTTTGRYAIHIFDAAEIAACPRKFIALETEGNCAFDFGGCNDLFIIGSAFGDCLFSVNSRGIHMPGTRWLNQAAATILGGNHTISSNDVNPQLTLGAGCTATTVGPSSLNHGPVIDNSGISGNKIYDIVNVYTPTLTTGGTAPSLGNGALTGLWSRSGVEVHVDISLTIGSTTSLGTGALQFSLPVARNGSSVARSGNAVANIGSINYTGIVTTAGGLSTATILRDTSGSFTFNSPATFGSGDVLTLSFNYPV